MNRILFLALVTSAAVGGYFVANPPVELQPASPGIQQLGNVNVSGKVLAGNVVGADSGATAQVVVGNATSTTGANFGGIFRTSSSTGTGVRGVATSVNGAADGGTFQTSSPNGAGVRGFATAATGNNFGVFGQATSPTGFAGFFQGRLNVTGDATFGGVISGNGSGLTSLNASNLGSGTLPSGRLSGTYSSTLTFSNSGNVYLGIGSALTGLNASNIASGLLSVARLPIPLVLSGSTNGIGSTLQASNSSGTGIAGTSLSGPASGVAGFTQSTTGVGVSGVAIATSGSATGVTGASSATGGRGVVGLASADSGLTIGGFFESASTDGQGVRGLASAISGNTTGVRGESKSPNGTAVLGSASVATGPAMGVIGTTTSTGGTGVLGFAFASTGETFGVQGQNNSSSGFAALFENFGLGPSHDVEISGPNGAINTKGFLHREYVANTPSVAIPLAYGSVSSAGSTVGGTGNFTVVHAGVGQYNVVLIGETYSNSAFTVTITPVTNSPRVTGVADTGVSFRVNIWTLAGASVDNAFQFTVWAANPGVEGRQP